MTELIYNGRNCRHCGQPIARPVNYYQRGLPTAVVCDYCWHMGCLSYANGYITQSALARELGVQISSVQRHLVALGLLSDVAYRAQRRRSDQRRRPQNRLASKAWYHTARGREQARERYQKHREHLLEYQRNYQKQRKQVRSSQSGTN